MEKEKENGLSGIYFLLKKWLLSGASELQAVPPATSVAAPAAVSLSEQKRYVGVSILMAVLKRPLALNVNTKQRSVLRSQRQAGGQSVIVGKKRKKERNLGEVAAAAAFTSHHLSLETRRRKNRI